jgi:hypothetical protein
MENKTKNELITERSEYSDGKDYSHLKPNLHLKKYKHLFEDGCVNCGSNTSENLIEIQKVKVIKKYYGFRNLSKWNTRFIKF